MLIERIVQQPHHLPIKRLTDIDARDFRADMLGQRGNRDAVGSDCGVHLLILFLWFCRGLIWWFCTTKSELFQIVACRADYAEACRTGTNRALGNNDLIPFIDPVASNAHRAEHPPALATSSSYSRLSRRWLRLSGNVRGILWLSVGAILFAVTDVVVKTLGRTFHPFELALFRYLIGFVMLAPVFLHMGWGQIKTQHIGLHLTRLVIACTAQIGLFVAVIHLKLADATAIMFSKPLFTTIVAVVLLSEIVRARRWAATIIGFAGVIIMVRPGAATMDPVALIAVGAALTLAIANVIIRMMSDRKSVV